MRSCIYLGHVEHHRLKPVQHQFRYPLYVYCLDLDELGELDRSLFLFGHNRFRPVSLFDADYLDRGPGTIREKLFHHLDQRGVRERIRRILLITSARYFNYIFNPVSFYYCLDDAGAQVLVAAEVNNTFGERHLYIPRRSTEGTSRAPGRYITEKSFHVSPFNSMEGTYDFSFSEAGEELDIRIDLYRKHEKVFEARLRGRHQPLTSAYLARMLLRHPLMPHMTVPRIYREALALHFRQKLPIYSKPLPQSGMTIRKNPPTTIQRQAMKALFSLLERMETGRLAITLPDGTTRQFGREASPARADITVHDPRCFPRIIMGADIGLGESYTDGDWDSSDVTALFRLLAANRHVLKEGLFPIALIPRFKNRLLHHARQSTREGSTRNIIRHYDLGNEFFRLFLDPTMTYSCALFRSPEETLEDAQKNKIDCIIDKAGIGKGDHVLELGCGWGSFALRAARRTGCRVTGVTNSPAQYRFAQQRIREEDLEDRITILLQDYREVEGHFDRIVSIEMLEGIGREYLGTFFRCCDRLLKEEGRMVLQVITIPDHYYRRYLRDTDWIQKHIFPGGSLPSLSAMSAAMAKRSRFVVNHLENIGHHYARTLREWRRRFADNAPTLSEMGFDRPFIRKWLYYFSCCEAGFATGQLNNLELVLTRPGRDPAETSQQEPPGVSEAEKGRDIPCKDAT